ncbi:hypothetical protein G6F57_009430 [Rhizopus arrhizus]|uniref:Uncharacterized protein n=1 Tax=Rhizopus oryzae TaxID=64495 RepID=A0A9P6X3R7_RHIOR|nr:hypothetical protein G6F24_004757 [Rhizopus arrhizus]KAG1253694.1 hypothetical protein G6F68_011210 [Rhizopus microsporus]KAG0911542.1 hypothetical protein G6F33_006904 [Rhizopus arrhizus]KAG0944631.1 hypothetical protein G6F30_004623 [Rhizopus arrhizus]KAG0950414.1 hypothetical protein G6F32_005186 [Rhizopus arrhizus]
MSFKDLQYSISKLTTNVQSQVARNNPLQNPDTKCLNYWLFQERNELAVLKTKTYQHTETNKAFREWVDEEREKNKDTDYEDDIKQVGGALYDLFDKQSELEQNYIKQERSNLQERKEAVQDRINHLKKSNPKSSKIQEFEKELEKTEEEDITGYKKEMIKEAFYMKLNALQEYAEKLTILAKFGKEIVDILDEPKEKNKLEIIMMDALLSIDGWRSERRPTLLPFDEKDAISLTESDIDEHLAL